MIELINAGQELDQPDRIDQTAFDQLVSLMELKEQKISQTEVSVILMLQAVENTQLSLTFRLLHLINEFLQRIWESIFTSLFINGCLTDYKKEFLRQEPFNWVLLQNRMRLMQKELIESNTQWAKHHLKLTDQDLQLFKLSLDLKDVAGRMTQEERDRPTNELKIEGIEQSQLQQLIHASNTCQLEPEEEMDVRCQILKIVLNFIDLQPQQQSQQELQVDNDDLNRNRQEQEYQQLVMQQ